MGFSLYPKEYLPSAYVIDYEKLYEMGFRGIIFDIDNTLVPHGAPADERARELFHRLHTLGYKVMLLSNNKEPRVKMFCDAVEGAAYIYKAGKPKPANYQLAMERMGTGPAHTFFVGDQILTDILGANMAGIPAYMVHYMDPHEEMQIVLKRYFDKVVLATYSIYNRIRKKRGTLPDSVAIKKVELPQ